MKFLSDHVYLDEGNQIIKVTPGIEKVMVEYDLLLPVWPEHYVNWCKDHCKRDTWYVEWCFEDYPPHGGDAMTYVRMWFTNPDDAVLFKLSNIQGAVPIYC
jgi:hypothetical protein